MSTPLPLASKVATDCVLSLAPLRLGRQPGKYVSGALAVLQGILYAWALPPGCLVYDGTFGCGLLGYSGRALSPPQILGLQGLRLRATRAEDYVSSATVSVTLTSSGVLVCSAPKVVLVDGQASAPARARRPPPPGEPWTSGGTFDAGLVSNAAGQLYYLPAAGTDNGNGSGP